MSFHRKSTSVVQILAVLLWALAAPLAAQITQIIDADGDGTGNVLSRAEGIAVDVSGNVYVAGRASDNVFRITSGGSITQIIDASGDGAGNVLDNPRFVAVDGSGNVYVTGADSDNAFQITPGGAITQIIDGTGDGGGNTLSRTWGVAADASGDVYVGGFVSDNVFRITPGGTITQIVDASGDGAGNVLDVPHSIAVDGSGNVYVTGSDSDNAFQITPGGAVTEIIDGTGDGAGNSLSQPSGVAVDASGNVYVVGGASDNVFRITPGGTVTEILNATGDGGGNILDSPRRVAVASSGHIYVAGGQSDNVFVIGPGGTITEIIDASGDGGNSLDTPEHVAVDASGNVYVPGTLSDNAFKIATGDLSIAKTASPEPVDAAAALTYTLNVSNHGLSTATSIAVTDTLPAGVGLASASGTGWSCAEAGGVVTCIRASLAPGAAPAITVNVTASAEGGAIVNNVSVTAADAVVELVPADNSASAISTVTAVADLEIAKSAAPEPVAAGAMLTYNLNVSNHGPSTATSVVVTDTLPAGVGFSSASGTGWSCAEAGGVVTCTRASLAVGAAPTIMVNVTAPAEAGTITNVTTVAATEVDPVSANDTAEATTTVTAVADLEIAKSASPDPVEPGAALVYTLDVSNDGPSTATSIVVTDTLPAGVGFAGVAGTGWTCGEAGGVVTCTLASLAVGAASAITIDVTALVAGGAITNIASVTAAEADTSPDDNSASASTYSPTIVAPGQSVVLDVAATATCETFRGTPAPDGSFGKQCVDSAPSSVCEVDAGARTLEVMAGKAALCFAITNIPDDPVVFPDGPIRSSGAIARLIHEFEVEAPASVPASPILPVQVATEVSWDGILFPLAINLPIFSRVIGALQIRDTVTGLVVSSKTFLSERSGTASPSGLPISCTIDVDDGVECEFTNPADHLVSLTHRIGADVEAHLVRGRRYAVEVEARCHHTGNQGVPAGVLGLPGGCFMGTVRAEEITETFGGVFDFVRDGFEVGAITVTVADDLIQELGFLADLELTKTDSQDPIAAGAELTYTLTVSNSGPGESTGGEIQDPLPAGLAFVASADGCFEAGGTVTCPFGPLAAGASVDLGFVVRVDPGAPAQVTNTATVAGNETDLHGTSNQASETTAVDGEAPRVTLVDTVGDTGDGQLSECEEARVPLSRFLVTFSESVRDPAGDGDPGDVTNPDSYRLIAAGPDRDLDSELCGTVSGDDQQLTISAVTYEDPTLTATLEVDASLADGPYRLLVCGSILDPAGNDLDGDGDGTGGDDFRLGFRSENRNLFVDGQLDCTLAGWSTVATDPGEITFSPEDVDGASVSGSARIVNLTGSTEFSLSQCLEVDAGSTYTLAGAVRLAAAPATALFVRRSCDFFAQPQCAGAVLFTATDFSDVSDTAGVWTPLASALTAPEGVASARCGFALLTPAGNDFEAFLDGLSLIAASGIFADGFESGDTSAWSSTEP